MGFVDFTWLSYNFLKVVVVVFNVQESVHRNNLLIYIQQDATLHSLFYLGTALHVSGGTITHHQEHHPQHTQPVQTLPR
jgi:hypothetical protein